jgi:hypothetical protein
MVSMLPGGMSEAGKSDLTQARMKKIEDATRSFMLKNLRRPCPSDFSLATNDGNFGVESSVNGTCTGGAIVAPLSNAGIKIVGGGVPVKTLGLSKEYAFDGYGIRLMYLVDRRATDATTCRDLENGYEGSTLLSDKKALDIAESATAAFTKDSTMWALLSYGADGHGAVPPSGSTAANRMNAFSADADTRFNAFVNSANAFGTSVFGTDSGSGIYYGGRLVQKTATNSFDDIVWYANETKATCCIGATCEKNARLTGAGSNTDSLSSYATHYMGTTLAKGDVNGDGVQDLVIGQGCYGSSTCSLASGRVYVKLGGKQGWVNTNNAYTIDGFTGSNGGYRIQNGCGENNGTFFKQMGRSIAVGDINADGYDDIVAGGLGKLAVIWGRASPVNINTKDFAGTDGFIVSTYGTTHGGGLALGDVNGDGLKDIIVGDNIWSNAGWIIFGSKLWSAKYSITAQGTCGAASGSTEDPAYWNLASGSWVAADALRIYAGAADVCSFQISGTSTNGSNVVSGFASTTGVATGYYISGKGINSTSSPFSATAFAISSSTSNSVTMANPANNLNAANLAGAGSFSFMPVAGVFSHLTNVRTADVNGDAIEDILLGDQAILSTYVIFGRPSVTVDGSYAATMTARYGAGTRTPPAMSPTWDGSATPGSGGTQQYLCAMKEAGLYPGDTGTFTTPSGGYRRAVQLTATSDTFTGHMLNAADMNNDGIQDIIIASLQKAYVHFGKKFTSTNWQTSPLTISSSNSVVIDSNTGRPSIQTNQTLPYYISTGDVNNDGRQDLLLGSYSSTGGSATSTGSIYVMFQESPVWTNSAKTLFGTSSSTNWFSTNVGLPHSPSKGFRIDGPAGNSFTYQSITGDFNADGLTDVAIASPGDNSNTGRVYMLWGRNVIPWPDGAAEELSAVQ